MGFYSKRILLTGVTGFVGANLAHHLVRSGATPHVLLRKDSPLWRIRRILPWLKLHYIDLNDRAGLTRLVGKIRPNIIFHTAVYGGHISQEDPDKIMEVNYSGTRNLVHACDEVKYDLFVNTGSSSEYGIKPKPMKESDVLEPFSEYGVSKAAATLYCQAIARRTGKPIVTLRLFSPYGPYETSSRLFPSVILSCLLGKRPLVSSPASKRDFVYIEDVVQAYVKAVNSRSRLKGEIINIAGGRQRSVGEVVGKIIRSTGGNIKPRWKSVPNPRVEPKTWQADISKAKRLLEWKPLYSLDKGINSTVGWFAEAVKNKYEIV
jgi:nucleoside-diphosphate-sugar epimerase